jgi:hypothetical protein
VKITLESTTKVVHLDGVACRLWEGKTAGGIEVCAFIARIRVPIEADQAPFQRELQECREPSASVEAIPLRMLL